MTNLTNYLFGLSLGMFIVWIAFSWRDVFSRYVDLNKKQIIILTAFILVDTLALIMRFGFGW